MDLTVFEDAAGFKLMEYMTKNKAGPRKQLFGRALNDDSDIDFSVRHVTASVTPKRPVLSAKVPAATSASLHPSNAKASLGATFGESTIFVSASASDL